MPNIQPLEAILNRYTTDEKGCWLWTGALSNNGYGVLVHRRKKYYAHRFFYEKLVGPFVQALDIDHICRNRGRVNPQHLQPVSREENVARSPIHNGSKTHCPKGHAYNGDNLIVDNYGQRKCRICVNTRRRVS